MNEVFILDQPERLRALDAYVKANWLGAVKRGRPLLVTLEDDIRQRSLEQNKRMHALFQEIAESAVIDGRRFSADAIKEFARRRFIGTEEIDLPDGTRIVRGISTTTLTVSQCAEFMEQLEAWAVTELGMEFMG